MNIIVNSCECEEIIKKSRFIGIIAPCRNEAQALSLLHALRQQHPHANHIVYAYRILSPDGLICRFHDAGEPNGTAGKPIFQHLEGKQLINLLVAVVRYFGGIKLGTGGLTRAYGHIAKLAIESAKVIEYIELAEWQLTLAYSQLQSLEYHLKKFDGEIIAQDFADTVTIGIKIPKQHLAELQNIFQ